MGRRQQTRPQVPPEFVRECFTIGDNSGQLLWRDRPASHFPNRRADHQHFNTMFAGKPAGMVGPGGKPLVRFVYEGHTRRVALLRLAWVVATGELPNGVVRPRDGDEWNASADNLIVIKAGPRPFDQSKGGRGSALARRGDGDRALIDALAESDGTLTVPQLSELAGQSQPCCCTRLAALESKGLVCGPHCNAKKRWDLTPAGRALASTTQPVIDERDRDILTALTVTAMGTLKLARRTGVCPMTVTRRVGLLVKRGWVSADIRKFFAITSAGRDALGADIPKPSEPWVKVSAISASSAKDVAERQGSLDDRTSAQRSEHGTKARQLSEAAHRLRKRQSFNDLDMTG